MPRDYNTAISWFKKAAEKNFSMAMFNLSIAYRNGDGVTMNNKEANRLNHLAALQGYGAAVEIETWPSYPWLSIKSEAELNYKRHKELSVYNI